jgi:hypothetical protein
VAHEPVAGIFLGLGFELDVSVAVLQQQQCDGEIILLRELMVLPSGQGVKAVDALVVFRGT